MPWHTRLFWNKDSRRKMNVKSCLVFDVRFNEMLNSKMQEAPNIAGNFAASNDTI